jgi:malate dehydrogenase (oxaloacetate-decarboxylating)
MNENIFSFKTDQTGKIKGLSVSLKGLSLLHHPFLNKDTAFTKEEREIFGLEGYLPEHIDTIEEQLKRTYAQLQTKGSNLEKFIYLSQLHERNMTLFYALVQRNIEEILPLIYTPTVGEAVENFSHTFRRPEGVFISYNQQDKIDKVFNNYQSESINFIIVTDGEAVLGIGDQGIGGMDISIGKLMVYIACSGINPSRVLPIQLDVGTNNEKLLKDEQYLGWRHPRISKEKYDEFIDHFVESVRKHFPKVFLHWEDFGRGNARRNLDKFQKKMCTFNDDMQGTGIVATANVIAAVKAKEEELNMQKVIMFGAGTAGCGIADQIWDALKSSGLSEEEAYQHIYLVDRFGLVTEHLSDIPSFQQPYIKSGSEVDVWNVKDKNNISLLEVVKEVKPTILIGVSTVRGAFTEEVVKEMQKHTKHPIIMPLSNPNSCSEAEPEDLIKWTDGNAVVAAGSPYDPVEYNGKTYRISQGNNAFIFPGLGLGAISVQANRMTDNMIRAACIKLSEFSPSLQDRTAPLLAPVSEIGKISQAVALAVAEQAIKDGVAEKTGDLKKLINQASWKPQYFEYTK